MSVPDALQAFIYTTVYAIILAQQKPGFLAQFVLPVQTTVTSVALQLLVTHAPLALFCIMGNVALPAQSKPIFLARFARLV